MSGETVFIVEDEALIAMELEDRLHKLGYVVCGVASNGATALAEIKRVRPGIVLMDINLGIGLSGIDVAKELREFEPLPVVFLSAYSDPQLLQRAGEAEPYGYLVKPFEVRELNATLQMALYKHQAIEARRETERHIRDLNATLEARVKERTAELEAANAELTAFSYSVAHDLRSPLRAMNGYSSLLIEKHQPEFTTETMQYLRSIRDNASLMGRLVDDLLEFSHLGHRVLTTQSVDLGEIARQVLDALLVTEHGRDIQTSIGPMPRVDADPALCRQILANALGNAVKFSRGRDPALIEVGYDHTVSAFFVRDKGVGFDMQYVDKVFGVFQRLHRASEFEGTGVGLAIIKRIVERHGGRTWISSQLNEGTTLYFTLRGAASSESTA